MNITINLYSFNGDHLIADKSTYLTLKKSVSAVIWGEYNILKPQIKLKYDADVVASNYVYLPGYGYFYVTDQVGYEAGNIILQLNKDLRYTYLSAIQSSNCTATRSNFYNKNIPDTLALKVPQERIQYRKLSTALSGQTYIMIVGG